MFAEEFLAKLDPSYRVLLQELVEKIKDKNEDSDAEVNKTLITDFFENYMLPFELWDVLFEKYSCKDNSEFAYYQFYLPDDEAILLEFDNSLKLMNLIANSTSNFERLPRFWEFPNFEINSILMEYEECVDKPISKKSLQKYEKSRKLYDKIMLVKEDSEAWFYALTETDDVEFVMHNVEYRLGDDLTDKALWKLYIAYLQKYDVQAMLHTYSKYCRFFLDDCEMKENYIKLLEKNGEFKIPWKNVYSLEKFDEKVSKECIQSLKQKSRKPVEKSEESNEKSNETSRKRKKALHYSPENAVQQNFEFKKPIIFYILKNSNFYVGQNLYKSCKYFYANFPHPFCYKLEITHSSDSEKEEIRGESIFVEFENSPENLKFKNLRITTVFDFIASVSENYSDNLLSKIIPRISICDAKYVALNSNQVLTFNELKFLIGHGNVVKLMYIGIKCLNENGEDIKIEEILKFTPKIMNFDIENPSFSPQSAQIMAAFPFQNKIDIFLFETEENEFEPYAFAEFIKKNASDVCEIHYHENSTPERDGPNFDEILQNAIDEKWKSYPKPKIVLM